VQSGESEEEEVMGVEYSSKVISVESKVVIMSIHNQPIHCFTRLQKRSVRIVQNF